MTTTTLPSVDDLSVAFCRRFRSDIIELYGDDLGREYLAECVSLNAAESDPGICHSHDHVDANQTMLDAIEELTGLDVSNDMDILFPESETETSLALHSVMQSAWSVAKAAGFSL